MTHSITEQRSRPELVAELYDRHAAGLFAYCADQLGDLGSAGDVLVAVLGGVPVTEGRPAPPRAALYAFARREIHRRDVVYSPPVVDPLVDPASALVERALSELRLHQREVLLLTQVCGLDRTELAWVLDVAPDTAEELAVNAAQRFTQSLDQALAAAEKRVPKAIADIYSALTVAPLRDVLGRLPWPSPPGTLRIHFAGSLSASPAPLFVKPRWPVPPNWPLPLGEESDPASTTGLFPSELLTPPSASHTRAHDATTAPMPKLRRPTEGPAPFPSQTSQIPGSGTPFAAFEPRRRTSGEARPKPRTDLSFVLRSPVPADVLDDVLDSPPPVSVAGPLTGDVILPETPPMPQAAPATGDVILPSIAGPLFTPRSPGKERDRDHDREPVYRMPVADPVARPESAEPWQPQPAKNETRQARPRGGQPDAAQDETRPMPRVTDTRKPSVQRPGPGKAGAGKPAGPTGGTPRAARPGLVTHETRKPVVRKPPRQGPPARRPSKKRRGGRHLDWAWELIGFVICVVIAMIVFFSVPTLLSP